MTPINDPRPFAEVLRDWMDRRDLTWVQVMALLDMSRDTLARALKGEQVRSQRSHRALMTLSDEGRA